MTSDFALMKLTPPPRYLKSNDDFKTLVNRVQQQSFAMSDIGYVVICCGQSGGKLLPCIIGQILKDSWSFSAIISFSYCQTATSIR